VDGNDVMEGIGVTLGADEKVGSIFFFVGSKLIDGARDGLGEGYGDPEGVDSKITSAIGLRVGLEGFLTGGVGTFVGFGVGCLVGERDGLGDAVGEDEGIGETDGVTLGAVTMQLVAPCTSRTPLSAYPAEQPHSYCGNSASFGCLSTQYPPLLCEGQGILSASPEPSIPSRHSSIGLHPKPFAGPEKPGMHAHLIHLLSSFSLKYAFSAPGFVSVQNAVLGHMLQVSIRISSIRVGAEVGAGVSNSTLYSTQGDDASALHPSAPLAPAEHSSNPSLQPHL